MVLEVLRALGRRWYVVIAGLLATAGLAYGALTTSPPEFHARGLVLLLPSDAAVGKGGNPFLQLSGLEQPAGILVASFSSAPARAEVEQRSPTADYTVGIDDSTRGPVIAVDVTAASEAETMKTLNYLVSRIPEELARLQTQVEAPADTSIRSMALTVDTKADVSRAGTIRMVIAALVVGLVGTGAAGYAVDALIQRRRLRSLDASDPDPDADSDPDSDPASPPERGRRDARRAKTGARSKKARDAEARDAEARAGMSAPAHAPAPADAPTHPAASSNGPTDVPASTDAPDGASVPTSSERSPVGRGT